MRSASLPSDDLDRGERHELLRVRQVARSEDVAVGEERRGPDERLAQRVAPLEVVGQRQLEDVLALGRDRRRAVGRVSEVALASREHGDGLQEVGVLHGRRAPDSDDHLAGCPSSRR